jgi:hypothetical protein
MPEKPEKPAKHWYYASAIVGCRIEIDDLCSDELTCLRSEVTCPSCLAQLAADKEICAACRLGFAARSPHSCDPALVYVTNEWPSPSEDELNYVLRFALGPRFPTGLRS